MKTRPSNLILVLMVLGYSFLYLPIILLIVFSFNESRVVNVWQGFSTKWYQVLFQNEQLLNAMWVSLKIATISASLSVVLGTLAAVSIIRLGKFRGKAIFGILTTAPLVMPEVITGLALLLLFVALEQTLGWPEGRGVSTIAIAHTTLCMAYVTVVVRARLMDVDTSLEEAALDLGAKPLKVFMTITLPLISPALISGWLLAFALSLDDLVIASFVAGPGSSTLPMVIFSSIRFGISPQINALATLIITVVALGVTLAGWLMNKRTY